MHPTRCLLQQLQLPSCNMLIQSAWLSRSAEMQTCLSRCVCELSIVIHLICFAHLHISSANWKIALLARRIATPMGSALSSSLIKINILDKAKKEWAEVKRYRLGYSVGKCPNLSSKS